MDDNHSANVLPFPQDISNIPKYFDCHRKYVGTIKMLRNRTIWSFEFISGETTSHIRRDSKDVMGTRGPFGSLCGSNGPRRGLPVIK